MSDPKEQQRESDELDLETETVQDLELPSGDADEIRGGYCVAAFSFTCPKGTQSGATN